MLQDLDPKLISALEQLRREFDEKLNRQRQEIERLAGSATQEPVSEPVVAEEPQPVTELDPLEELKLAATEIDRAESQADVLDAFIRGASRFSPRAALFLYRDGSLQGWGGTGFAQADASIAEMRIECLKDSPWEQVISGTGGICLSSTDCAHFLDELGVDAAEIGILIPFILRRQVVAVVYADRTASDQVFNISGLQLLSFLGGQTVETLPIRERAATSSLQLAVATAPPVEAEAPVEAAPAAVTEETEVEAEAEPVAEEEAAVEEEPAIEAPAFEAVEEEISIEEEAAYREAEEVAQEPAIEETVEAAEPDWIEPSAVPAISDEPVETTVEEEAAPVSDFAVSPVESIEAPPVEIEPVSELRAVEEEDEPAAEFAGPEAGPPAAPDDFIPPPEATEPTEPPSPVSTQIEPPQDVEGPGWAFTTTRIPTSAGVEALHEEARRLARLLVTEIKLYNEELVEEGRQAGDVYSRLREDIDRSRQIFDDRIDPEVRSEKDYFREALVRILAGGDPSILGIQN
jgi:hypothetical protein